MNRSLKKLSKLLLVSGFSYSLAACDGGGSSGGGAQVDDPTGEVVASTSVVYFDSLGRIPVSEKDATYLIRLHNPTATNYTLTNVSLINDITDSIESTNLLASTKCQALPANGECSFELKYKAQTKGAYRLVVELTTEEGSIKELSQVILTGGDSSNLSPINMEPEDTAVVKYDQHYSLATPVYLNQDFAEVKITNGELHCGNGFAAGSSCTLFSSGDITGGNLLLSNDVTGLDGNGDVLAFRNTDTLVLKEAAHLLVSNPGQQRLELSKDKTLTVRLYNDGNLPLSGLKTLATGANLTQDCASGLDVGERCKVEMSLANITANGRALLAVRYQDRNRSKSQQLAFDYSLKEDVSAFPLFDTTLEFNNAIPGHTLSRTITMVNHGNTEYKI